MERLPFPIRLCSAVAMLLFLMLFVASRWSLHLSSDASGEIPFMQKPALIHTLGSWLDGDRQQATLSRYLGLRAGDLAEDVP